MRSQCDLCRRSRDGEVKNKGNRGESKERMKMKRKRRETRDITGKVKDLTGTIISCIAFSYFNFIQVISRSISLMLTSSNESKYYLQQKFQSLRQEEVGGRLSSDGVGSTLIIFKPKESVEKRVIDQDYHKYTLTCPGGSLRNSDEMAFDLPRSEVDVFET